MFTSKTVSAGLLALLASTASAQTHSDCKPTEKDCPPAPALGKALTIDYAKGADKSGFFKMLDGTSLEYDGNKGAVFKIASEGNAPTLVAKDYIFFGKVEVELQAAPGVGIVTSVVLQSDDLDEIDWEWVGGDNTQVQTNYFSKGDTTTYDRGGKHPVNNPVGSFHKYTIDWTKDYIKWIVDGNVVRELKYADAKGGATFPQTPCQVRVGTWVAGRKDASPGTVEWAGGFANFADGPFNGYYKSIAVTDYATGATSYVYGDRSGTYKSIVVKKDGDKSENSSSSSSSSSKPSSTSSSSRSSSSSSSAQTTGSNSTTSASTPSQTGSSSSGSSSGGASGTTAGAGAATSRVAAPSSGFATVPNLFMVGAAAVLGFLAL
ncbi:cell wall glucanosyltransferase [Gaeumannomyces tritici R3-111a-1]|uniref:Crh-like protein n=1 Tax=Gaeumannomyces tritici (strain R3-111a-1) TaxID=644352 RepID=J3P091_GAET3|nr:cell wall glucanosyltransferase [Gaeumannomyces tritici R3-111a-1]EJT77024.1 cell wall glucanosyltransferase [Gaeumannomyces tritici R3-111a-1]